jgi:hypothetical protein
MSGTLFSEPGPEEITKELDEPLSYEELRCLATELLGILVAIVSR